MIQQTNSATRMWRASEELPDAVRSEASAADAHECLLRRHERWQLSVTLLMASFMISFGERLPLRTCKSSHVHRTSRRLPGCA